MLRSRILLTADSTYANYRIPGMLVTRKGTILIYVEARRDLSDWASMDICLFRSIDHGESFSLCRLLAEGTKAHPTVNNPVMVQDQADRIHFLYCEDYGIVGGRVLHRVSDDDGLTFGAPRDITAATQPALRNCFAFGPGHGLCTPDGTLLVPVWLVPRSANAPLYAHAPSVITTLYSTDCGESWQLGSYLGSDASIVDPNESVMALLSDGRIYRTIRTGGELAVRAMAISRNGYADWQNYRPVSALTDPGCFGSVASMRDGQGRHVLLIAHCAHPTERRNVTVAVSIDDGKAWLLRKTLDTGHGGYVEINVDPCTGLIYVLYESNWGETNTLVTFDMEWLFEGGEA